MQYRMNDRIDILDAELKTDKKGFQTIVYNEVISLWANHKSLSYKHYNKADTLTTKKVDSFLVRNQKAFYDDQITDKMFVRWKSKLYKIISIDDTYEDSDYLLIRCESYE